MKTYKKYYSIISSEINNICELIKDIICYLNSNHGHIEDDITFEIKVILNELLLNAVKHGNKCDTGKTVKVSVGLTDNGYAYFIIIDEGEGCNRDFHSNNNKINDMIFDICDMKETGRGIFIVKNLSDSLRYNLKGNKVVVLKKLNKS